MTSLHIDAMSAATSPTTAIATTPRHVRSRTQSISSDRPSTIAHSLMSPPQSVSPEAAFIAASAASQIVTNDHDSHSETWYDQVGIEPSGETALVATGALQLANNFVDQLLFNVIAVARSTSLSALRPAVSEVLKPKLARDAVNQADEELREYLGGGEVEDLAHSPDAEAPHNWDLELAWKRTRLRCMVYSSLGDMEEEDEDYYMEQEHFRGESGDDMLSEAVSPAVAIFLTSILEFMGEQVLVIAGQAAFNRLRVKYEKELKDGTRMPGDISDRIVVEELDMERVALDRTLGRLWRAWKKRIRAPAELSSQRSFTRSATHSRHGSIAADTVGTLPVSREVSIDESQDVKPAAESKPNDEPTKEVRPSAVPLPMSNNDVAEIEVPGLVSYSDEEDSDLDDDEPLQRPRPKSWMVFSTLRKHDLPTPAASQSTSSTSKSRKRANSVPTLHASPIITRMPAGAQPEAVESNGDRDGKLSTEADAVEEEPEQSQARNVVEAVSNAIPTSPISKMVTGAAAVGSAALAGVAAIAHGTAPQTMPTPMEEEDDELDDFTEEPQILTSSRVSIGGRSSPAVSESGSNRPPSILVGRSNSLSSVRMIEVHSPRSPSVRSSRHGSGEFDYPSVSRSMSLSREGSVSTPPIAEEGTFDPRGDISAYSSRESSRERNVRRTSSPSLHGYGPSTQAHTSAPTSAPTSTPSAASTKVTILNQSVTSGAYLDIDTAPQRSELPPRMSSYSKPPTLPTLPEKSANRPTYAHSSVDRTTSHRASPESPKRAWPKQGDSPTSSTNSNKFKAVRSSEESTSQRAHDVAKNFEELLQNDETIQYTLTPENMRDMELSQAPKGKSSKDDETRHSDRSRSSSVKRSLSLNKSTGLGSHPPESHGNAKLGGPVPRAPPVSMTTQGRMGPAPQARDARIPRESIQDFAEFIRSTGPPGERGNFQANKPVANPGPHRRDISSPVPASIPTAMPPPKRTASTRARLQARDAAVSSNNESSDLIDFIRRGPPSTGANPRIPRNIAPFRNTMDSDQLQMSGATGGKAVDAALPDVRSSQASTNVTETSVNSSINSQSALLNKANKPTSYSNNFDEEDMIPKRKQRRVRDPYAIDFSDEEDLDDLLEEEAPKPKPKPKKEESLIDFLNNYDPPPDPSPPQPFVNTKQPAVLKKKSTTNLIARLRNGSASAADRTPPPPTGRESRASTTTGNGRGYTPIVASMPPSGGNSAKINDTMGHGMPQNRAPSGRVPMKHYEPRDAHPSPAMRASGTSDLARFLRESEPPPSTLASASPAVEDKPSGFSRIFERRKKSVAL
ncbi:hypothetical protein PG991_000504 [Apiospora marii]|uniref:Flo11 n=1 Tax=Apiospora marii TaxID=335849 RepID=A0ABR1T3T7_9PEZI